MFAVLTDDKYFETIYNDTKIKEKGGVTMCDIVQGFVKEGIEQGIEQGKTELIRNLIEAKAGTIEQIAAWVKLPVEEVLALAEKVPVQA